MSTSKTIYFIRHGQSEHNVYEEAHCHEPDYSDPMLFDAALSHLGQQQVSELPKSVEEFLDTVELVVVSPLSRAIRTCLGAFDPIKHKIVVNCACREQVSNACDIGTPKPSLMSEFPHLDFSLVASDVWWYRDQEALAAVTADNYQQEWRQRRYEEPEIELLARITEFRSWLGARPEKVIVVVGHSNFFKNYLGMSEKLKNCEVHKHHIKGEDNVSRFVVPIHGMTIRRS